MSKFKLKILIVPDGESTQPEEDIIQPVMNYFTPDLVCNPDFWEQVPNLENIEFITQEIPDCKENLDYIRLMSLLNLVDETTFAIYVRSTTISLVSSNKILKLIYDLCNAYLNSSESKSRFDLMYLAKWADRCDQYTILGSVFDNINLVENVRPYGLQSVLFSPCGAQKIKELLCDPITHPVSLAISQLITGGKLYSLTTSPSIMNYNVLEATKNYDYIKTHECADPPSDNGKPTHQGSNLSLFVFIIIVIVVVVIFYFLIVMVGKTRNECTPYYPPSLPEHRLIIGEGSK